MSPLAGEFSELYKSAGASRVLEFGIAGTDTITELAGAVRARSASVSEFLVDALRSVEPEYRREAWPAEQELLDGALQRAAGLLAEHKDRLLCLQAERLGLRHEQPQYDVFLVARMHEPTGAYSHPTVINAVKFDGLSLIETIVHELTHVLAFDNRGQEGSVFTQLERIGSERGVDKQTVQQVAHLLMFYASGALVREVVSSSYVPYADANRLYERVAARGGPTVRDKLSDVWRSVEAGSCGSADLAATLIGSSGGGRV